MLNRCRHRPSSGWSQIKGQAALLANLSYAYVAKGSRHAWIRLDPQPFAVLTELLTMTAARIPECAANIFCSHRWGDATSVLDHRLSSDRRLLVTVTPRQGRSGNTFRSNHRIETKDRFVSHQVHHSITDTSYRLSAPIVQWLWKIWENWRTCSYSNCNI